MKAGLLEQQVIQIFVVNDIDQDYFVTWNKKNHTENRPNEPYFIPEFVVEDNNEVILEQGCQDWSDAVAAVKEWDVQYGEYETK